MKDRAPQQFVKAPQSRYIARSIENRLKAIIHGIPGRCCRMNIISGKTDKIYQQKDHGKAKIYLAFAFQIKPQTECNGNRNPAKVEYTGKEIAYRTVILCKILAGNQSYPINRDTEQGLLRLIQSLHINRIHLIVGIHPHPVVRNAKDDKRKQRYRQFTGCFSCKKEYQKQSRH